MASQSVWRGNLPEKAVRSKPEKRKMCRDFRCGRDCRVSTPPFFGIANCRVLTPRKKKTEFRKQETEWVWNRGVRNRQLESRRKIRYKDTKRTDERRRNPAVSPPRSAIQLGVGREHVLAVEELEDFIGADDADEAGVFLDGKTRLLGFCADGDIGDGNRR